MDTKATKEINNDFLIIYVFIRFNAAKLVKIYYSHKLLRIKNIFINFVETKTFLICYNYETTTRNQDT